MSQRAAGTVKHVARKYDVSSEPVPKVWRATSWAATDLTDELAVAGWGYGYHIHKHTRLYVTGLAFPLDDCLVALVVKASAPRAEDSGFESRVRRDFFRVESYQGLKN